MLSFIIPLVNFLGLEIVYLKYPNLIYLVTFCLITLTAYFFFKQVGFRQKHFWSLLIPAVLFVSAHHLTFIFLEGGFLVQAFILINSFALFVFLYCVWDKYSLLQLDLRYALENIIGYFNLAIFFFIAVDFFYFDLNTNGKFIWLFLIFCAIALGLSYSSLEIFNLFSQQAVLYLGVLLLIMIQVIWVINFLPISVYSKAALVSLVYYTVLGLSKHYLVFGWQEIKFKVVRRYLFISVSGLLLVLLTSRW